MNRMMLVVLLAAVLATLITTPAAAQAVRLRVDFGPKVTAVAYRPGVLTVGVVPDVVVVRSRPIRGGYAVVYRDRPDHLLRTYHRHLARVGFTRVSVKEGRRKTTVVYRRGAERVCLVMKRTGRHWEAQVVAI